MLALQILRPLVLPADTLITFQVDMTAQAQIGRFTLQTNLADLVGVRNLGGTTSLGWILLPLTNNSGSPNPYVFTGSLRDTNAGPGGTISYKFYYRDASGIRMESPISTSGRSRIVTVPAEDGASLGLPIAYFGDLPPGIPVVTNKVTFRLDLSAQFPEGAPPSSWDEGLWASCRGSFNGWEYFALTNNPSGTNSTLFSGTACLIGPPGVRFEYQFVYSLLCYRASGIVFSEPLSLAASNRSFTFPATNGAVVLPLMHFGDLEPGDLLRAPTTVHFMVDMTEARTADGRAFDPAVDKVYLNGDFLNWSGCFTSGGLGNVGWARWEVCPGGWGGLPNLTKVPPNCVYSLSVGLSPPGGQVLAYRYSINGQDNEPTGGRDHVRWVRGTGEYSLPLDKFGAPVQEQSFGDLTATLSDPQQVLISWLGRPGVRLQSCANPATGPWQDHPETDGLSATNWPVAQASVFFRLAKR